MNRTPSTCDTGARPTTERPRTCSAVLCGISSLALLVRIGPAQNRRPRLARSVHQDPTARHRSTAPWPRSSPPDSLTPTGCSFIHRETRFARVSLHSRSHRGSHVAPNHTPLDSRAFLHFVQEDLAHAGASDSARHRSLSSEWPALCGERPGDRAVRRTRQVARFPRPSDARASLFHRRFCARGSSAAKP